MSTESTHKEIPTTRTVSTHNTTCDICRAVSVPQDGPEIDWDTKGYWYYTFDKIQISRSKGTGYPEGGSSEDTAFHICPECWESKLVPFMAGFGAEPTTRKITTGSLVP